MVRTTSRRDGNKKMEERERGGGQGSLEGAVVPRKEGRNYQNDPDGTHSRAGKPCLKQSEVTSRQRHLSGVSPWDRKPGSTYGYCSLTEASTSVSSSDPRLAVPGRRRVTFVDLRAGESRGIDRSDVYLCEWKGFPFPTGAPPRRPPCFMGGRHRLDVATDTPWSVSPPPSPPSFN